MGNLSDSILVPGVFVTVDNSLANTSSGASFKTVFLGQKTASGTASAEVLTSVFSKSDAAAKFGNGSILSEMFAGWYGVNNISEVYAIPLADAAGATAATKVITPTGPATSAGTYAIYINGKRIACPVASGATAADLCDTITALVNADVTLPVTATDGTTAVTLTAKNKGTIGNQITVKDNQRDGDAIPAGLSVAITAGVTGATDPDVADAIAALPDGIYNLIVNPFTDATSLITIKAELDRRWGNTVQLDGHALNATAGTAGTVATKGDTLNSEHLTFIDGGYLSMTPAYIWAATLAGRVSFSASADPARPFRSLVLSGVSGDTATNRRTLSEKNTILNAGIGTHNVLNDGTVVVDRLVTTYKTNGVGAADNSYQNTNTMLNLSHIRQAYITRMLSRFPRHKLGDDGQNFGPGQPIATPAVIKGEIIALYNEFITDGLCENVEAFAATLSVERDDTNRGKVNVTMQPILIGQLYQFDITLQFIV